MNKLFSKIAALSVGLAMAVGVGVAVNSGSSKIEEVKAADSAVMTFDFEDESAHRTSGSNTYSESGNTYEQHDTNISLKFADSVTTGTPLGGSANIIARMAKNKIQVPYIIIGPIDLSNYEISAYSYNTKSVGTLTVTSSYSLDGENYTVGESHTGNSTAAVKTVDGLSIVEESSVYIKIEVSITSGTTTTGNRDTQIDDVKLIGHSTGSKPLESISCNPQSVSVTSSVDLASKITFNPSDAANKNVSFSIKENDGNIEMSENGVVTGIKGGSATVTISPEDTSGGASPIDVVITVNSIPAPALIVGDQYVIYAVDSANNYSGELTGVSNSLGTVAQFTGDIPSCEYVLTAVEGYYENTVSLYDGSKYLSLNSAGNNLHTSSEINAKSSWTVTVEDDVTYINNVAFPTRGIRFNYNSGNARFACYSSTGQVAVSLYHYVDKPLEDFTIDSEIDVYISDEATIGVTYNPADASDKELNWSSNDEDIATVNENGVVTGVAVGETTVTASKTIGGNLIQRSCTVHVLNNASTHRGTAADPFNVLDAVQVAKGVFVKDPDGNPLNATGTYYISGLLTNAVNRTTSTLTFWIGDEASQTSAQTGAFEIYKAAKVYGNDLANEYSNNNTVVADFPVGAHILVVGQFTVYNGTPETSQNTADIKFCEYVGARKYAESFNAAFEAEGVCDSEGESDVEVLASVWGGQSSAYDSLDPQIQEVLTKADAKTTASATAIELCAAKYDYIGGKYQTLLGAEFDFMGRNPSPIAWANWSKTNLETDNNMMIVIVVISSVTVLSLGVLIALKKKKHN
jgi:uncharacterized protein YjdB